MRSSWIASAPLAVAFLITGQAHAALDGIYSFDNWKLSKTSRTSTARVEQNGTSGFTLYGNSSGIGRHSRDNFSSSVQSVGSITGTLSVTRTRPGSLSYSFNGTGPVYNLSYDFAYTTADADGSRFDPASCLGCGNIFLSAPGTLEGHVEYASAKANSYGGWLYSYGERNLEFSLHGPGVSLYTTLIAPELNETQTYDFTVGTSHGLNIFANIASDGRDGGATLQISDFEHNEGVIPFSFSGTTGTVIPLPGALPLLASGMSVLGFLAYRRRS
jgi:hypothetical protein